METTQIHRFTALDTINRFIAGCDKAPFTPMDLDIAIILIRESISNGTSTGFVEAVKHLRTVTKVSLPVKWDVGFEYSSGNALCKYIKEENLHNTGTLKDGKGLDLKDADDIVQFVKANIGLLTD
jgi:hypothetical protein